VSVMRYGGDRVVLVKIGERVDRDKCDNDEDKLCFVFDFFGIMAVGYCIVDRSNPAGTTLESRVLFSFALSCPPTIFLLHFLHLYCYDYDSLSLNYGTTYCTNT